MSSSTTSTRGQRWWFWPIAIMVSLAVHAVVISIVPAPGHRPGFLTNFLGRNELAAVKPTEAASTVDGTRNTGPAPSAARDD